MPRRGVTMSPEATAKNNEAIKAWKLKNIDNLSIGLRKGKREAYKRLAAARGTTVSAMIQQYMDREYKKEFKEEIQIERPEG